MAKVIMVQSSDRGFEVTVSDGLTYTMAVTNTTYLPDLLGDIEDFLRGMGFRFEGHLAIALPEKDIKDE